MSLYIETRNVWGEVLWGDMLRGKFRDPNTVVKMKTLHDEVCNVLRMRYVDHVAYTHVAGSSVWLIASMTDERWSHISPSSATFVNTTGVDGCAYTNAHCSNKSSQQNARQCVHLCIKTHLFFLSSMTVVGEAILKMFKRRTTHILGSLHLTVE